METMEEHRLIKIDEVLSMCGVSKPHIYRMISRGQFPAPVRVGPRAARWRLSEVKKWIDGLPIATEANWN